MKFIILNFALFLFCSLLIAESTPIDLVLKEDGVTLIAVEFKSSEIKTKTINSEKLIDGTYHYNVYVPSGYNSAKDRQYACLFIASPGGNAGLGNIKEWAKNKEWIVVMLVESKNGNSPWPSMSNFVSAHDDAVKRLRIQNGFKFGTGQSGGARVSSLFASYREGFAGVVLQAAGFAWDKSGYNYDSAIKNKDLTVYAIIGKRDSNLKEIAELENRLPKHTVRKLVSPDSGHEWASAIEMEKALAWSMDNALQKARMTEENKVFLLNYRETQWKQINQLPVGLEKLSQMEDFSDFLKTSRTTTFAGDTDIVKKVSTIILDLKKDPLIIQENGAQKNYLAIEASENNLRSRFKDKKQLAGQINGIYQQYMNISKKYPDTQFGKKAEESAIAIKNEFFGDKK